MTPEERFERIEDVLSRMVNQHAKDFEEMKALWRQVGEQQLATTQQIQVLAASQRTENNELSTYKWETERRLRESGEALDARIGKLVSAIGLLIGEGKTRSTS